MLARIGRIALLVTCTAGCYAPAQARYDLAPSWQPSAIRGSHAAPQPRLRHESFVLSGFSGSGITRQWPLMDSRTRSERYSFRVQESGSDVVEAHCRVLDIADDQLRERTSLDCAITGRAEATPRWQLALSGRGGLVGRLTGPARIYRVVPHGDSLPLPAVARLAAPDYQILDGEHPVALVRVRGRHGVWLDPDLEATERSAIMAAVFGLLLQQDARETSR
jgi:hypothetical protein